MRYRIKENAKSALRGCVRSKGGIALVVAVLVAAITAAVGLADVWTQTVQNDSNAHLRIVYTYANGVESGWHTHPGLAIVQLKKGTLTITNAVDCKPKTVSAGDTSIEVPYTPVRAVATGEVAWTTTFVLANAEPPTTAVGANPCP